jgi:protein-tyrosine-phosphatase
LLLDARSGLRLVTPRLLFVCVENSCRSQMAEAFAHRLGGASVQAASAGSRPSGAVNSKAVASMAELGYDLSSHRSRSLDVVAEGEFDAVVTMGCGDACPHVPAGLRLDWDLPDPKQMDPPEFAAVRDEIEVRVRALLEQLGVPLCETSTG